MWHVLQLASAAQVLAVDTSHSDDFAGAIGLLGAHPKGAECDYEVRMLATGMGIREDPITGSLNAALAHWLHAEGRLPPRLRIAQGTCINRHGRVEIARLEGGAGVTIGGEVNILIDGQVLL